MLNRKMVSYAHIGDPKAVTRFLGFADEPLPVWAIDVKDYVEPNSKNKRVYISGPMTGYEDFNFPYFNSEAQRLRDLGYEVVNPAELTPDTNATWEQCLRKDLIELMKCDAIVMLDGWEQSAGAHLELNNAHRVKMEILFAKDIK